MRRLMMMAALVAGMWLMGCEDGIRTVEVALPTSKCQKVGVLDLERYAGGHRVFLCDVPSAGRCVVAYHYRNLAMSCPAHLNQPAD